MSSTLFESVLFGYGARLCKRLQHEADTMKEKVREDGDKIKQNKELLRLVSNVVEAQMTR